MIIRRICSLLIVCLAAACSSESDEDHLTIYPMDQELVETRQPQDAIRRFEAEYSVKPSTGHYRIYVIGGLNNDCFVVDPLQGTQLGVEIVHASREDVDAIYCYNDAGEFVFRL